MRTIKLSVKSSYLESWGIWEGVRELVQNGKDAETEFSAPLSVRHCKVTSRLFVENDGCVIPREALLFGETSKGGDSRYIGRFGEGLKGGALALLRCGLTLKIRNGTEVWNFYTERSDDFDAQVLCVRIDEGRKDDRRVRVEIGGLTAEAWERIAPKFLFLKKGEKASTYGAGDLLTDPSEKGNLYVKGIFVSRDQRFSYGFNFVEADLDRDRKMIASSSLEDLTARIIANETRRNSAFFGKFLEMLETSAQEVKEIGWYAGSIDTEVSDRVAAAFVATHGEKAFPVLSSDETGPLVNAGLQPVKVTKEHRNVLARTFDRDKAIAAARKMMPIIQESDLTPAEKDALENARTMVEAVTGALPLHVRNVNDALGIWDGETITLSRQALASKSLALKVLIHECAHRSTGAADYTPVHTRAIEDLWEQVFSSYL